MPEDHSLSGPFVQIACICQTTIQEVTGSLSVIRVMDRIGVAGVTPRMQPQPLQHLVLVIVLKSGGIRETHQMRIIVSNPSGDTQPLTEVSALFEGEDRGVALVMPLAFVAKEEGLHWFEVYLEEMLLTRIPLRVIYQRAQMIPMQAPPAS